jgi:chromosome segregation ATPase
LERDIAAKEKELEARIGEIETLTFDKNEALREKEELGARIVESDNLWERLRSSEAELGARAAELESLREMFRASEEDLGARVAELGSLRGRLMAAEEELEAKSREAQALAMSNAETVREKDQLSARIAELEDLRERLRAAETELRGKVEGFSAMAESADRMREKIDSVQNELWMKETESAFRLEEIERLNREIADAQAQKEGYREKAAEESASRLMEIEKLRGELANVIGEKEEYRQKAETAGEALKRLEGIERAYRSKEEESGARLEEIGRLNSEISGALRAKDEYRAKAEELDDVKAKLKEAESFLAGKDVEIAAALGEIGRLNIEIAGERARIGSLEESSRREIETLSARVNAIDGELSSAKQHAAMARSERERLKSDLDDAITAKKAFEDMELSARQDLGERISYLEGELAARSSEIARLNERAAGLDSTISALAAEKVELERKARDIDPLVQRIGSMERDLKIKQEVSIGQYQEIDRLKAELAGVLSEKTALESRAYEADVLSAKVSSLEDELARGSEEAERLRSDISGLNFELSSMARLRDDLRDERLKAEESARRSDGLTEEIRSKEKESEMRQRQIASLNSELAALSEKNAASAKEAGVLYDRIKALESELAMKGASDRERQRELEEIRSVYDLDVKRLSLEVESLSADRQKAEQLKKEITDIKAQLNDVRNRLLERDEEIRGKQLEVQVLNSELLRAHDEKKKIGDAVREREELKSRLEAARSDIFAKDKALAEKQAELDTLRLEAGKLSEDTKRYDINMDKVKVLELSLTQMEHAIEEHRRISGNIKSRLEKSREKIAVLNNKTRDNIEALAEFAGTREFMELRRSVYIDDLVKRYEREINDLRAQLSAVKRTSVD